MRNLLLFIVAIITSFAICGCKKEPVTKTNNITNGQAAIMAAAAISVNAYGLAAIKNDITLYVKSLSGNGLGCGVLDSSAVAKQEPASDIINYNYALGYYYTVNCAGGIKDSLSANVIYTGSFDAPSLSVVNSVNAAINVADLSDGAITYTLTGNYKTSGSFQTLDNSQLAGNNNIIITVNRLLVNKTSRAIISGQADITISGTVKNSKSSFSYNGSIIFNSATAATLTLDGQNYTINTTTADVTAL